MKASERAQLITRQINAARKRVETVVSQTELLGMLVYDLITIQAVMEAETDYAPDIMREANRKFDTLMETRRETVIAGGTQR